jgi:hypothetical protein
MTANDTSPIHVYSFSKLWEDWFSGSPLDFARIYLKNRETQKMVKSWLTPEQREKSLWQYGVPSEDILDKLNQEQKNVTYSDLLAFLSLFLSNVHYLKIGVSSGKNIVQISRQLGNSRLVGLDVEEINPVIETFYANKQIRWSAKQTYPFTRFDGAEAQKHFTATEYDDPVRRNNILYLSGDKFQEETWRVLSGMTFNLVFSDAFHTAHSIETEIEYMKMLDLIDKNEFIMVWDDLSDAQMVNAFFNITNNLETLFPARETSAGVFDIHRTYGGDERGFHQIGLFVYDKRINQKRLAL